MASAADKLAKALAKQVAPSRNDSCSLCRLPKDHAEALEAALIAKRDNPSLGWQQIMAVLKKEFGMRINRHTLSVHYNWHWSKRHG